jgi:hypothetical protein
MYRWGPEVGGVPVLIHRLLQDQAFEPEQIAAMAAAFEDALRQLGLIDRSDPLCEEVARKIIELGQQGVRNPQLLRQFAIKDFGA